MDGPYVVELADLLRFGTTNRGSVTPASKQKLDAEIAELERTGANPRKLADLRVERAKFGD